MFCIIIAVALAITTTTTAAFAVVSSSSISFQGNQTAQHTNQQPYNATESMTSTFKAADSLLIQAKLNDLRMDKIQQAHTQLSMAKTQIEQHQIASLDVMSNPVLQLSSTAFVGCSAGVKDRKY